MKTQITLISIASIIIILAGLKAASAIVVPFLLAIFIAVIISPAIIYLQKLKIPRVFAFIIVVAVFFGTLGFFGSILFHTLQSFVNQLPELQTKFDNLLKIIIAQTSNSKFIDIQSNMIDFDINLAINKATAILKKTGSLISMSFVVFLIVAFIVFESTIINNKIRYFSKHNRRMAIFFKNFISNLKRYLLIKTIASIVTGVLIGLAMWILGVPYAPLWGMTAFLFNYIPTIGSILAIFPTLFVTLSTMDISISIWVIFIYIFVNILIGNVIEPRFMGKELGISTVVVLLSVMLWGFVFGIGGLFLAVPLTMSIQIALKSNPKTKSFAILLSNRVEDVNNK